jgi:hypothetical protein
MLSISIYLEYIQVQLLGDGSLEECFSATRRRLFQNQLAKGRGENGLHLFNAVGR